MVAMAVGGCAYTPAGFRGNYTTLLVDQSGWGGHQTIQSAIDSVPPFNQNWICIYVRAGTYMEKVTIPPEKSYIYLKGDGKRRTYIIWDGHDNIQTATFSTYADNIIVKSMTFVNSYNFPPEITTNPRRVAVAALVMGDNTAFYRCGFKSWQDTLWDVQGHHYFKRCTINGAVDFIFGNGQSIYEKCSIAVNAGTLDPGLVGFITAQGRDNPDDNSAFVFKNCRVFGTGKTFLGRPWRSYARVIFYNTFMDNVVVPEGWTSFFGDDNAGKLSFAEYGCRGPGSDKSARVGWLTKMSRGELERFTSLSFVNNQGWLSRQPLHRLLE
nr:probable pectinesterase 29 [Ipomoea batatas]